MQPAPVDKARSEASTAMMAEDQGNGEKQEAQVISLVTGKALPAGAGGPKDKHGLTWAEEEWCQHVSKGESMTQAFRLVHPESKGNDKTVWNSAYKIGSKPVVKARLAALRQAREDRSLHDAGRTLDHIVSKLWQISNDDKASHGNKLKAVELLGKLTHVAAFSERSEVTTVDKRSDSEVQARIEELLSKAG